jgi:hypothetical protein
MLSGEHQSGQSFRYVDMAQDEAIIQEVQNYIKIEEQG